MGLKLFVSSFRILIGAEKGFSVKENFHRIASKMHTVKGRTTNEHEETRIEKEPKICSRLRLFGNAVVSGDYSTHSFVGLPYQGFVHPVVPGL